MHFISSLDVQQHTIMLLYSMCKEARQLHNYIHHFNRAFTHHRLCQAYRTETGGNLLIYVCISHIMVEHMQKVANLYTSTYVQYYYITVLYYVHESQAHCLL